MRSLHPDNKNNYVKPLLELTNVNKTFPGVKALADVELSIQPQEVHALIGANGSGKSTLIKVLSGYHRADVASQGRLLDTELDLVNGTTQDSRMRFVHQDLGLIHELSVMDNLALGRSYRTRYGVIEWSAQREAAQRLLHRFGVELDVTTPVSEATPVERVIIAIAAALDGWESGPCLLVLDEPTAVLPSHEVDALFEIVNEIKSLGASVLYVSHRLDELSRIADRVTVLRGGQNVVTGKVSEFTIPDLASSMVGEDFQTDVPERSNDFQAEEATALEARNLSGRYLTEASFQLKKSEILGIAGLPGSGREELSYIAAGYGGRGVSGDIRSLVTGNEKWIKVQTSDQHHRLPLVPSDRASEAVFSEWSVRENLVVRVLTRLTKLGVLGRNREEQVARRWMERFGVVAASAEDSITTLSGGNQQKVIIARAMAFNEPIVVMCEPTAGVDIGARASIYQLMIEETKLGRSILVSSSDEGDLVAVCDRVLVLREGRIVAELSGADINRANIINTMEGV